MVRNKTAKLKSVHTCFFDLPYMKLAKLPPTHRNPTSTLAMVMIMVVLSIVALFLFGAFLIDAHFSAETIPVLARGLVGWRIRRCLD